MSLWQQIDKPIVILCDCDPDTPAYGGVAYNERAALRWRGVVEGIPALIEALEEMEKRLGVRINIIWCVRADAQMKEIYGDAAWPYREFIELWTELEKRGDVIAWHPHLWRWSTERKCWYQEIADEEWMGECLEEGYAAICSAANKRITIGRMGWEFHNNFTIRVLDELGVEADFSAVPGYYCQGDENSGSCFHKFADWRGAPRHPYHPSKADYRRPAQDGEEELAIWEVPLWSQVALPWRVLGRLYGTAKSLIREPRFSSLVRQREVFFRIPAFTMLPSIFVPALRAAMKQLEDAPAAFAFHCDELLPGKGIKGKVYGLANAVRNAGEIARVLRMLEGQSKVHRSEVDTVATQ